MKLRWLIDYDGERRLQQFVDGEWQDVETVEYYSLQYDEAQKIDMARREKSAKAKD